MTEEISDNQVESEMIEPEDVDEKANPNEDSIIARGEEIDVNQAETEMIEPEDVDEKENPNEGLIITKGPPKILSRYRCERRTSCHDLCKYGIRHATEEKPWKTAKKMRERKANVTSLEGTDSSGRSSKLGDHNYRVDIKEVITNNKTAISEKNSTPYEEIDVSMEHNNSDIVRESSEVSSLHVKECSKSQRKWELVKNKCAFGSSSRKETTIRSNQKTTSSNGGKDKSSASSFLLSPKQNVKKSSSSSETAKNLKKVSSGKNHENGKEAKPELANNDNLPEKILHAIEPTSENLSKEPTRACNATKPTSPSPSPSKDKSLKRTGKKTGKSAVSASSRKGLRHVGHGTLTHQSSGNKFKTNIQLKTHIVSRSPSALSSVSSSNTSLRKQNGTTSKPSKTGHVNQGEHLKVGYKMRPKMTTIVGVANKAIPSRKLTFSRGKVIEIQPQSNNIPRRLKFKPVRFLGDDARRDANGTRKRIITNKEADGAELNAASIKTENIDLKHQTMERGKNRSFARKAGGVDRTKVSGSKSGSEKVVLRHQDVEGRKQNTGLYNNVIEETATKLAGLRKSKVRALVGAFETVISLDSPRESATAEVSTVC
ncbi:uncharacterized protein LOC127073750 isoform X1 [Lathyrus oleraceus]|uniref:Calmodulin-binding domain-containing protein n=1 Tax=Pisum sativum TaxID=3888 RepID=A0A9D5ALJ8_PEA|nr:uncharacterized protein LOC127073750 isoform X1 [Pisum sativum]XP_050870918.1 uncharacterized protein LOC127073750 isoform X1 [Pisum sativum]KAI5416632.1 hypothetical protein KIW84_041600 [Pisum sativum]